MKYWVSQNTPIKQLTQINNNLKTLIDYEELSNDIIKTTMIDIIKDNEINEEVRLEAIDHLRRAAKINFIKIRDYKEEYIRNKSIIKRYQNGIAR